MTMLTPVKSPMECFGLSHDSKSKICQACRFASDCRVYMGNRLTRIPLAEAKFSLIPETITRQWEIPDAELREIQAIYTETFRLVFGCDPKGSIGSLRETIARQAKAARCSISMFILTSMHGFYQSFPDSEFTPRTLADGPSAKRVLTYAEACRERYGHFDVQALALLTGSHVYSYDLHTRMLQSEILAGKWVLEYKMFQSGAAYGPLFDALENKLDPSWLAIEPHYQATLDDYSTGQFRSEDANQTRHDALVAYKYMKKHPHQAMGNFRVREQVVGKAIGAVLEQVGFETTDFEVENKAITDPLQMWSRLGLALQHYECLKLVKLGQGIYSKA